MNSTNLQILPAPPSLMKSLMAGFDAISNHIGLILFSVALDAILWFSPPIRFSLLLQTIVEQAAVAGVSSTEMLDQIDTIIENLNLLSVLRTIPVGVPSLMAGRSPISNPLYHLTGWQAPSFLMVLSLWFVLVLVGMVVGTIYFSMVAQVVLTGKVVWRQVLVQWPWMSFQIFLLSLFWFALASSILFPFVCILSVVFSGLMGTEQFLIFGLMIFGLLLVWLMMPLVFSPHGIFMYQDNMWISIKKGSRLVRFTLPTTALLLLIFIILSEGLRLLWNVPADDSWLMLVGITGHAFVTSGILAASFVYYRDAQIWIQKRSQQRLTEI